MRRLSAILLSLTACSPSVVGGLSKEDNTDIDDALKALPDVTVLSQTADGMPTFIVGELARPGAMQMDDATAADTALRPALAPVLKVFRMNNDDLVLRKMNVDEEGYRVFRYTQVHNGLPVIGGDMIAHVDIKGSVSAMNGTARGDISDDLGKNPVSQATAMSSILNDGRFSTQAANGLSEVYIQTDDGVLHKAYEVIMVGTRGKDPARDKVYVDQDNGAIVAVYAQIHSALNRKVYSANNGTSLPGTLKRSEGQAANSDNTVNLSYDDVGDTYNAYKQMFNRDSYDNAGATLIASVHYDQNYCNAYWDSTQMVYGDGDPSQGCSNLAESIDVTGHELTHAVTEHESGLNYSGESGGLNEAMSDNFGATVEAWVLGGSNGTLSSDAKVWLIGDTVLPPFLRNMCDPAADGTSADVWSSTVGNLDVHYSSGPQNLAFCLLAKGGMHPRGKTTNNVPGIGMDKAIRIIYKAQTDYLTSTSNYAAMRTAMTQAAVALGYDQATQDAVGCAYAAIKVGTAPTSCGGSMPPPPPPPGGGTLTNNVPVTGISGAKGSQQFWTLAVPAGQATLTFTISGGSGDADMYVQFGAQPTLTTYQCRPYVNGNSETCTINAPQTGTYYVMLNGYAAYSGVTLKGSYVAGGGGSGDPYITSGVPQAGLAGATGSNTYFRIAATAGKTLTVKISGGTGDADLYTRFGSRPTTSTYSCRPYLTGNSETCTITNTSAGDYYIMLRGYQTYSGVTLTGTIQ